MTPISPINRRHALAIAAAAVALTPALAAAAEDDRARILQGGVPPVPGPKRTIGVGQIDVTGAYANASATNVGGPIAGMLTTALSESGEFLVEERDAMPQLITEMDLAKSHVTGGTDAPMPGHMLPIQYLIVGSVTDYSLADKGGGLSIGGASGAINFGRSHGDVGFDLRIVDTRTGSVIKAFKVHRKIVANTIGFTGNYSGVPIAANRFFNTPLGDATRKALNDAVIEIATALAAQPWRGQVVKAEGGVVWANAGGEAGVAVGDRMSLERVGETLTDPATGAVLSEKMLELGIVTITNVEPKLAWGSYQPTIATDPARGDFLILQAR